MISKPPATTQPNHQNWNDAAPHALRHSSSGVFSGPSTHQSHHWCGPLRHGTTFLGLALASALLLTGCAPTTARTGQPAAIRTITPSAKLPPSQPLPDSEIRAMLTAFSPQFAELGLRPERAWGRVYAVRDPLEVQATLQALAQAEEAQGYRLPPAAFYVAEDLLTFMTVRVNGKQVRGLIYRQTEKGLWVVGLDLY